MFACVFRMEAASAEKLLEAFRMFDPDNTGSIPKAVMAKLMVEEGEPFTQVTNDLIFFCELFILINGNCACHSHVGGIG